MPRAFDQELPEIWSDTMTANLRGQLLIFVTWGLLAQAAEAAAPPACRVGFAERDISPEIGMERPGGYSKARFSAFHDPCKVRAVVFDDGQQRVALVGIDALGIRRDTVEHARKAIHDQCGIEPEAILIGASHSHSSGPTVWIKPGDFDGATPLVQELAYEKCTTADPEYLELVEKQLVAAVCEADRKRTPARCGVGRGKEDQVAFNRRFRMRTGLTATHPRPGNPDILEPAGKTDPEVGVIGVWDESKKLIGCVVNFACHATLDPAPGAISANYIYYLEKVIRGSMGNDVVVVFLNGASGDITQVDNRATHANMSPERWSQFVGGRLGAEALKVLLTMEPGDLVPVNHGVDMLSLKRRVPRADRVQKSLALVQQKSPAVAPDEFIWAKEIVLLDAMLQKQPQIEAEVQMIQVEPAVFVTTPAEYFCEFGLEIKAGSSFPFTFPVSLANGCVGYVPTEEAFGPRGGGYETRLTSYSNLEPTAGRKLADAGLELIRRLKPGAVPQRAPATPYTNNPWAYGNVPPELD